MMLKEFVEKKHYKFADSAADWKEAIRMSCEPWEFDGTVEDKYKEDIIKCGEKYCDCSKHRNAAFSGRSRGG